MGIHIFSNIGGIIESSLVEPAQQIAMSISGNMIPFVAGGITIWVMVYSLAVVRGAVQTPVSDFSWRIFKISLILFFGIGGGIFQPDAFGFYSELSNTIYTTISQSSGGACPIPASDPMGIYGALDCSVSNLLTPLFDSAEKIGKLIKPSHADVLDVVANLASCLIPFIFFSLSLAFALILTIGMVAFMGFEVISLRVTLALAFALGPIFIYSLAFEPIKSLFSNWLNFVIKSILLQALFITFIGVAFGAFDNLMETMFVQSLSGLVDMLVACAIDLDSLCIMMVIFTFVAARLPSLASELSGGGAGNPGLGTLLTAAAGKKLFKWTAGKMGSKEGGKIGRNG